MTQSFATTTTQTAYAGVNDIFIGSDGNLAIGSGVQAVLYACQNAARTQLGECIFQTGLGLPNFQLLWIGVPNIPQWRAALQLTLEQVPGVADVLSIDTTQQGSVLIYTARILTIYGEGVIRGTV